MDVSIMPLLILASWVIALILGAIGVITRRRKLLLTGMLAALVGLGLTYWLKRML